MNAADIIMAAVRDAVPADVGVYDAIVGGIPTGHYIVVFIPDITAVATGVDAVSDGVHLPFSAMYVAGNNAPQYAAAECRWMANAVRNALTDLVVTADDWQPARIQHEGSQAPRPDETTPDKKVYATAQFSLRTALAV